ncbi:MAG: hypothetical protein ACRDDY_11400 [Clostridium sp.]
MIKPFILQVKLKKDTDGLTIWNVMPISFSYIIVILIILAYIVYEHQRMNPIIIALAILFIFISVVSGITNSRMVIGFKKFSYMYSTLDFKEMSKITITPHTKKPNYSLITVRKNTGGELAFILPNEKKDIFKKYMAAHGKGSVERH